MEKVLFVNACVRKCSRTHELAQCVLDNLGGEICEINLAKEDLKPLGREQLSQRERFVSENDFPMICLNMQSSLRRLILLWLPRRIGI